MLKKKEQDILEKYISGRATETEIDWVEKQLANKGQEPIFKESLKSDWDSFDVKEQTDLTHLLGNIHEKIQNVKTIQDESILKKIYRVYIKVAAVLLIPILLAGVFFLYRSMNTRNYFKGNNAIAEIVAPPGSRLAFQLPDGSNGILKGNSALSYSVPFTKSRMVNLNGEAWFDVVNDSKSPFEVLCGESKIKVLGTSFYVNAYAGNERVEVFLKEGVVEFSHKKLSRAITLKPNERVLLKKEKVLIDNPDPEFYTGWTEGKLIFKGDSMVEVAERIGQWYDVQVEIRDKELEDYTFRATFTDDPLEEVLQFLSLTSPIDYLIIPRKQDETVNSKRIKVILSKRKKLKTDRSE